MPATSFIGARLLNAILIATPPLFWAGNFIVGRAIREQLPPLTMSCLRWVIAFAVILPFAWRPMVRDVAFYRAHPWRLGALSLAGVVAFNSLVYAGLRSTSAANALLLNSTIPALIIILNVIVYKSLLRGRQFVGLTLSLCGVAAIILRGDPSALVTLSFAAGDLIVFTAMVAWALYTLWLRPVPAHIDRVGLLGVQIMIALPILALMALGELAAGAQPVWSLESFAALAYIGIFPSVVAYLAYNLNVARIGATLTGLSIHLMPVFGVSLAVALLGEPFRAYHAIGIALILVGLFWASLTRRAAAR